MMDTVPAHDRGLLLGDGLFETVLFKAGAPVLWQPHMDRLARGCAALGLPAPDPANLAQAASQGLSALGPDQARAAVRLTWTAGSGGRGLERPSPSQPRLIVSASPAPAPEGPATLALTDIRRNETSPAARLKTLAYLDNVMARRQARALGADEALMLNSRGEVACCAAANLFWMQDDTLFTPAPPCGVLNGIMRAEVLSIAPSLGLEPVETTAGLQALEGAAGVFITNSLIGVRPVRSLDGRALGHDQRIEALARALSEVC
jgi:branched-chain amino acid aminotransferase/4-amino-4-deoxychorismate lyase